MVALGSCSPSIFQLQNYIYLFIMSTGFIVQESSSTLKTRLYVFITLLKLRNLCQTIINNEIMLENYIVDKENNANLHNQATRRQKYLLTTQARPITPILETTFNPLPKINKCSIPIILSKKKASKMQTIDYQHVSLNNGCSVPLKLVHKQGPIIAKSQKLKEFFRVQSSRYNQPQNSLPAKFKGRSLDLIPTKRQQRTITPLFSQRQNENKSTKRRQQFERLYMHQKQQYQRLLKKYGISQSIEDEEYENFMLGEY